MGEGQERGKLQFLQFVCGLTLAMYEAKARKIGMGRGVHMVSYRGVPADLSK